MPVAEYKNVEAASKNNKLAYEELKPMTIQKKSLLSSLNATKKAIVASNSTEESPKVAGAKIGRQAIGRQAIGRQAIGRQAIGRQAIGRQAIGRQAIGRQAIGRQAIGRQAIGRVAQS